ncbi:MAG: hypothetical protein HXX12_08540 [Geothrix sp.]|uniref:hypothetical protein n=1 Tax=Geothrix sp. TaxID=1962974 RepID=UPI00185AA0D1|nr:hypothetical protein [Geothrix sp.]NWJ41004.1 hypothetical protein [Geothrix sp.]WIL20999.1 MAG: hypothetical protein QOZ81_000242 [Geothrix sp.]
MLTLVLTLAVVGTSPCPSPNDRCPVTGLPVTNPMIYKTVEVRGHSYYVHDRRAGILLRAWPEGYLDTDGTPRSAHPISTPCMPGTHGSPQGCRSRVR